MLKNKHFENDLVSMIKEGHTPLAIGVAETEVKVNVDKNGNTTITPLTENEVKTNSSIKTAKVSSNGQTQYRDKLSLQTTISGSSPNYWIQSNAYWDGGLFTSNCKRDAIGVTWDNNFYANNSSKCTLVYSSSGVKRNASLEQISNHAGAAWSFPGSVDMGRTWARLNGVYAGVSIHRSGSSRQQFFTSEYVHTSQKLDWSASVTYSQGSSTKYTITLKPTPTSWKLVSYLSGTF